MATQPPSTSEHELTGPDRDDTVSATDDTSFGTIVLEYVNVPHDGHTYALTFEGQVLRMFYGSPWRPYYTVNPTAVAEHVASVRLAKHQRVTADRWRGPVPDIARPGWVRGSEPVPTGAGTGPGGSIPQPASSTEETGSDKPKGEQVTETETAPKQEKAQPKEKAAPKETKTNPKTNGNAPKLGARAKRALESGLDLSKTRQKEVLAAAEATATARGDKLTRVWDIYEAAGVALPEGMAAEKKEWQETGRLPKTKSGGGGGRGNAPKGEQKKAAPSPSTMQSESPESKPTETTEPAVAGESEPEPATETSHPQDETTL